MAADPNALTLSSSGDFEKIDIDDTPLPEALPPQLFAHALAPSEINTILGVNRDQYRFISEKNIVISATCGLPETIYGKDLILTNPEELLKKIDNDIKDNKLEKPNKILIPFAQNILLQHLVLVVIDLENNMIMNIDSMAKRILGQFFASYTTHSAESWIPEEWMKNITSKNRYLGIQPENDDTNCGSYVCAAIDYIGLMPITASLIAPGYIEGLKQYIQEKPKQLIITTEDSLNPDGGENSSSSSNCVLKNS